MNNVASKSATVRRFERGESYVEFRFDGNYVRSRNTLLQREEMSKDVALNCIANLLADKWVEVDAC